MAWDVFKPRGSQQASKPTAGGAVVRSAPILGIVKDNIDPIKAGRLQVYISDIGGDDPDNSDSWITVGYMSPFFGLTQAQGATTGFGNYEKNPASYGMWTSPPDIGTTVICIFINGDSNYGYYIGCVPEAESLYMVPAIGGSENIVANQGEASSYGGASSLPVTNINTNNKGISDSADFLNQPRPVHSYVASVLSQQGLIRDPVRGVIGSSSQRESPSRVGYGVSTPGRPIYEGGYTDETLLDNLTANDSKLKIVSRRAGHTFVMDDGDSIGRDQLIRLRSTLGHQILMSDSGQTLFIIHANGQSWVELGKEGTIDMYATNSVNVRTQGDLNLHADNNVNIQALKQLNLAAETINISSDKETTMKAGTNFSQYAQGKYTVKVTNGMSMASGGEASYASDSATYINGSRINLNTGSASLVPQDVPQMPVTVHTDTLFDASKGWAAAPGKLLSIVSRAPAHAPWSSAGQGVDVKVDNNAATVLSSNPNGATVAANNAVAEVQVPTVTPSIISTVPSINAVSGAIDKNATSALVAQVSTLAATGIAKDAVAAGMGIVNTVQGKVASIGQLAQTPAQLEAAGIIKTGAAALVNSLVQGGKTVEQALTNNLFTGKAGAENLNNFVNNTQAQVDAVVTNLNQAQVALTNTGLITGKESATQLGGLVMAASTAGVAETIKFAQNAANTISNSATAATQPLNNLLGPVQNTLSAGNFATNMSSTVTSGLTSLAGAVGGLGAATAGGIGGLLSSAKGLASAAFSKITAGFPTITAGVPQNLRDIVTQAQVLAGNAGNTGVGAVSGLTSGLSALPGAEKVVASVVNNATSALNSVPGVASVTALLNNPNALIDKLKSGATSLSNIAAGGLSGSALSQLDSAITSLSSGGAVPIALAKIGINTNDRSGLISQIQNVLGNPKIPAPNYTGNAATFGITSATVSSNKLIEDAKRRTAATNAAIAQLAVANQARIAYVKATSNLPEGDPERVRLLAVWQAELDKSDELRKIAEEMFA